MDAILRDPGSFLIGLALFGNMILSIVTFYVTNRSAGVVAKLEVNTNSIKDALVKVTASDSYAKGVKQGEQNPRK